MYSSKKLIQKKGGGNLPFSIINNFVGENECENITKKGSNCYRALNYKNNKGQIKNCTDYCLENIKEWLPSLLKNLPTYIKPLLQINSVFFMNLKLYKEEKSGNKIISTLINRYEYVRENGRFYISSNGRRRGMDRQKFGDTIIKHVNNTMKMKDINGFRNGKVELKMVFYHTYNKLRDFDNHRIEKLTSDYYNIETKFPGFEFNPYLSKHWKHTSKLSTFKISSNTYLRNKTFFDFLYFNDVNTKLIYKVFSPTFEYPITYNNKEYKSIDHILDENYIKDLSYIMCVKILGNKLMIDILKSTENKVLMDSQNLYSNLYGDNIIGRILMCIRKFL